MKSEAKQSNYHFSYSTNIQNSQEKVWAFLTDVSRWHEWDTELQSALIDTPFGLNTKGVLLPKKGPKLRFYISTINEGTSYTFKTKMPIGYLVITRELKHMNGFTTFTDDIQFTGFLKHIFGLMLGNGFQKVLPEVMGNFKRIAEKE